MADISKIKLPDGTTYSIKDGYTRYIGTTAVQSTSQAQAVTGLISATFGTVAGSKCTEIYDTTNKCLKFVFE